MIYEKAYRSQRPLGFGFKLGAGSDRFGHGVDYSFAFRVVVFSLLFLPWREYSVDLEASFSHF